MKDAGIRIRVEKELRDAFVCICQTEGRRASDVLREFMQTYVDRRQGGQGDLFTGPVRPDSSQRKRT
ncbi:plasmid-related protein [Burkholderia cepacia]|nr:plasmid-related protein [Burkholderia cepacia]MBB0213464.1 plasmid-related protein [Ralstonia pickettii]MBA9949169.1 plasmid-related protein [Burkholderia cepacia]MBA9979469.1 plasmid-related protein [Burkholderia cepacia]MBA9998283.1 plasmid-related protein [Burkholderia cepacia]